MTFSYRVEPTNLFRFSFLFTLCLVAGCNGNSGPKLYPVRGKLSIDGEELSFGIVRFHSEGGQRIINGRIQDDGYYNVELEEGEYIITLAARPPITNPKFLSTGEIDPSMVPKSLVPREYRSPWRSKLRYKVKTDIENVFDVSI